MDAAAVRRDNESSSLNISNPASSQLITEEQKRIASLFERLPSLKNIFDLHKIIGEGSYSSVYLASLKCDNHVPNNQKKFFAIKHLIPISHPDRIEHELRCLRYIGGCDNVVGVELCLRHLNTVVFVMPYLPHLKFSEYFMLMDLNEIKLYMKNLLLALKRVHRFNVIHRDVKPSNFLYDRTSRRYLLVDFGLAQKVYFESSESKKDDWEIKQGDKVQSIDINDSFNRKAVKRKYDELNDNQQKCVSNHKSINQSPLMRNGDVYNNLKLRYSNVAEKTCPCSGLPAVCTICLNKQPYKASRSGTQGFRPPEVLLKYTDQTTAVDVWACGVIFLSFLSGSYPFFRGSDDLTALAELITIFGSSRLKNVATLLGCDLICNYTKKPFDLYRLCVHLRYLAFKSKRENCNAAVDTFYKVANDFIFNNELDLSINNKECTKTCNTNGVQNKSDMREEPFDLEKHLEKLCDNCALPDLLCVCLLDTNKMLLNNANFCEFPEEAFDLLEKLLDLNPHTRISASDALKHPFLSNV